MELSWPMKLRITAAMAIGVVFIGFLAWPLVAPSDGVHIVTLFAGNLSIFGAISLVVLAFLVGIAAYFVAWPHGREIGILAVPTGLGIWAVRTDSVASLLRSNPSVAHYSKVLGVLKWEPLFWLAVIAAGFLGVILAHKLFENKQNTENAEKTSSKLDINIPIALIATSLIAHIFISLLAQAARGHDPNLGKLTGQPYTLQICFAVFIAFGVAGFAVKALLDCNYIWPGLATVIVTFYGMTVYGKTDILEVLIKRWPVDFFVSPTTSIWPVQMVAFGTIGVITGYWKAIRFQYWRKHQSH